MNLFLKSLGLLLLLVINSSCINKHEEIPIERIFFDGDKTQGYIGKFVIIRDSIDLKKYSQIFIEDCDSLTLPEVNLDEFSIIGKTILIDDVHHLLGSETKYYKTGNTTFVYEIDIKHAGIQNDKYLIWSYSKVPKLSSDDSVQFKISYSRDWLYID